MTSGLRLGFTQGFAGGLEVAVLVESGAPEKFRWRRCG
jgi:hypothetical protein